MIDFQFTIRNPKNPKEMYIISQYSGPYSVNSGTLCIERGDGENGQFDIQGLYDVIDKFYEDNF